MNETVEQYIARIQALVGTADPLVIIESTAAKLGQAVSGLDDSALDFKPSPEKWSIRQQVAHLADAEMQMGCRFRWSAAETGKAIVAFDQDRWAHTAKYDSIPLELSLATFTATRRWTLDFLRRLTPAERQGAFVMHQERGKETLDRLMTMMAGHDLNHLKQIAELAIAARSPSHAVR